MNKLDASIVLAAYNEEACVAKELNIIKNTMDKSSYSYEIILVDDASADRTAEIARQFDWVRLIQHPVNMGSGGARKTGTLAAQGEIIVWSDVDMSYPNKDIPLLVDELKRKNYDQVIGARTSEKGTLKLLRTPAKWFIRRLACFLTDTYIPDLNSGLRAFKKDIALKYLHLLPKGFSCVTTITLTFLCNGYSVGYIPIDYHKRVGKSKFHAIKDTRQYLVQVIRMIMLFNPLKVFLPISLILLGLGALSAILNVIKTGGIQQMDLILFLFAAMVGVIGLLADLIVTQHKQ